MAMTWEKDLKPIFRPEDYHMGKDESGPVKVHRLRAVH